jgi:tRNA A37 threonylcarbamoyladenosine synthetase subunit TsaC/SUA5/YrdC
MAVTSANRSGGRETMSDMGACAVFGDEVAVYIPGQAPGGVASTVVGATGDRLVLLRQGPVSI